jgi:cation transport ATPase
MSQNEKADEKQAEKQEEKSVEEKWGEKDWRRDRLSGTIWALILIMAGVVLLIVSLDLPAFDWLSWDRAWGLIMIGAALLLVLEIAVRMMMPSYAAPLRGRAILAAILGIIGLSNFVEVELWPLIIIAIGVSILLRAFTGQQR